MRDSLVYVSYVVSAVIAAGIYAGLPKDGKAAQRGATVFAISAGAAAVVYLLHRMLGSVSGHVVFCVLSALSIGAAVRVVTHPRPVYSALYFVLVVLATSALLIQVGAEFLAMALVIVYAGAILVTYVFVIMLSQQSPETQGRISSMLDYDRSAREPFWACVAGFMLMATLAGMIVERSWGEPAAAPGAGHYRNTVELGKLLMTDFAVSVELAAVLLMVALVGSIAIARKRLPSAAEFVGHAAPGEIGKKVEPF